MTKPKKPVITEIESTIAAVEGADAPETPSALDVAIDSDVASVREMLAADEADLAEEIENLRPRHALDDAPLHSKIVLVINEGVVRAVLAMPASLRVLPLDDPASALPNGARIRKQRVNEYVSEQLSPAEDRNPLVTSTAMEAVERFVAWFHGPETPESRSTTVPEPQD